MAKFIKVTETSGGITYINVDKIIAVYGSSGSYIITGETGYTTVKETKEEVMELIRNA